MVFDVATHLKDARLVAEIENPVEPKAIGICL